MTYVVKESKVLGKETVADGRMACRLKENRDICTSSLLISV